MDYFQLELLFERLKIAIVVEEWKAAVDTEGGDPTIYNLAATPSEGRDCFLLLQADERSQRFVNHSFLCWQGRQFLRLGYQLVIQNDVGSQ